MRPGNSWNDWLNNRRATSRSLLHLLCRCYLAQSSCGVRKGALLRPRPAPGQPFLLTSALIPFPTAILSSAIQTCNEFDARVAVVLCGHRRRHVFVVARPVSCSEIYPYLVAPRFRWRYGSRVVQSLSTTQSALIRGCRSGHQGKRVWEGAVVLRHQGVRQHQDSGGGLTRLKRRRVRCSMPA